FYATILLFIVLMKPRWKAALVLGATVAFGFIVHAVVAAWAGHAWTSGLPICPAENPQCGHTWIAKWVVIPHVTHGTFNNYLYIGLGLAIFLGVSLRGSWRLATLPPILYLVVVVWENVLLLQGNLAATAGIVFGLLLIGLMTLRPQGLLGSTRVE